MADGGAGRCLSDLSDDLLRHILFLAPDREGASTAVLSRRWRWLWRTSGAVFLDSRSFIGECSSPDQEREDFVLSRAEKAALAEQERQAFLLGADKALAAAAAHGPIRRLTLLFFIGENSKKNPWRHHLEHGSEHNLVEAVVTNPAARRVEELQIVVKRFTLSLGSLPSEALRVLRLTRCSTLTAPPPGAVAFPMLVELHLQRCYVSLVDFRTIVGAAPRLSTLHLTSSTLCVEEDTIDDDYDDEQPIDDDDDDDDDDDEQLYNDDKKLFGRLLIPAVTSLVVADCEYGYKVSLELDVPRLQYFRYRGHVEQTTHLSLKSQASSNMIQVDLDLTSDNSYTEDRTPTRDKFLQFIRNFSTTKFLKLKLDFTKDHLALEDKAGQDELLGGLSFYLLDQLELEAEYKAKFEGPLMVMLANMLHSCPMVRDLRLKLRKRHEMSWVESSIDKEDGVHFDRSVDGFRNRRRPMVSLGGEDDEKHYLAFGIVPGLTGEPSASCLQSHLKRVSLQFFMDKPNCLGVQLAKFFAENAMVLQDIHIDDGCHEMLEHVNPIIRRWIAKTDNKCSKKLNVKD